MYVCSKKNLNAYKPTEHPLDRGETCQNVWMGSQAAKTKLLNLTVRASTIPSNIRGCQSGTWSAENRKRSEEHLQVKLQRDNENENKAKTTKAKKKTTKNKCQKGWYE